jgi:signal transduction histidine kinase
VFVGATLLAVLVFVFGPAVGQLWQAVEEEAKLRAEILDTSLREQQRIGRDLHDGLGQHLTGAAFMSQALVRRLRSRGLPEADDAAHVERLLADAIRQTHDVALALNPVEGDDFESALHRLAAYAEATFGVTCRVRGAIPDVDPTSALHLYRIAQEAITNAVRHGEARRIEIVVEADGGAGTLTVVDDGRGFEAAAAESGMGLRTMRQRAALLQGSLAVVSTASGGTRLVSRFGGAHLGS